MERLNPIAHESLTKLPGDIYLDMRKCLNEDCWWDSFLNTLDGIYQRTRLQLDDRQANRVEILINELNSRGMTIQLFIEYVRQAAIEPILRILNISVSVRITRQPFPLCWNVTEGESLSIEVRATGSPPPLYQWFKDNLRIPNANGDVLQIPSACAGHSGVYTCQVRNNCPSDPIIYSNPVEVSVSQSEPLAIIEHPRSYTVSLNGNAWLTCKVWGDVEVDYQWMRNGKEITDGESTDGKTVVSGSSTNELKIKGIENFDWVGCYCCRVSRGEEVIFTTDAILQVDFRHRPPEMYSATDKVALLMGAEDYRSEVKLLAPQHDVQTMATVFRNLNFKVVSLMNLTKKEMLAAIHEFKYLVGEGVYCVFYFCGHGFEASGQCYLLPPDAPLGYNDSHCVNADAILFNVLLPRKPKFCCMILDICRLKREGKQELLKPAEAEFIMCYGTSQGNFAYEQDKKGILVSHLKNILQLDLGVEDVFRKLREEMTDDPILNEEQDEKQAPEIRTTLSQANRSFRDKINSKGYTQESADRQLQWENAHWQPASRTITVNFQDFDVKLKLEFQSGISNMLTIFCSVVDPGHSISCKSRIREIPLDLAERAKSRFETIEDGALSKNCVYLQDIQRLKANMLIKIAVVCVLRNNTEVEETVVEDIGLPLVSRLRLWKEYPDLTRCQEAEEVDIGDLDLGADDAPDNLVYV